MDFFKLRNKEIQEEHGAGDEGTPSLVAKYKAATPGQTSSAPSRQPARKGDKLNAKMDYSSKIKQDDITVKNSMSEAFEDPEAQKAEMAETKLHFIKYASDEILEYIRMGAPIEEWYQIKLAKVHADMEGLHSYMEGEKRRTGMTTESTEVNEISKKTLGSYIKRASHDTVSRSMKYGKNSDESGAYTKDLNKINKREAGIRKATDRLTKEDAVQEGENKQMKGKDPCWKGYQMVGTKKKNGKDVPNCVPANEGASPMIKAPKNEFGKKEDAFAHAKKVGGKVMKKTFTNPRTGIKNVSYVVKESTDIQEAKMSDADVLSAAKRLAANGKDEKTKSFGKGLVDFYNKNDGFTPDQVAGLQNIMKNASFQMAKEGVTENESGMVLMENKSNDLVKNLVYDYNERVYGDRVLGAIKFQELGTRTWTRSDGKKMKQPGEIFAYKDKKAEVLKFWKWFKQQPGVKALGKVSSAYSSDPPREAVKYKNLYFGLSNYGVIEWGSMKRVSNPNSVWNKTNEGVMKNIKRQLTARDADSRAGEEASKMMDAQHSGDKAKAAKHDRRFKKLSALTRKESVTEKLDPSQGAGEYVKDFQKSDAPQFKGKTKKERQKMAVAAYLSAKRGD